MEKTLLFCKAEIIIASACVHIPSGFVTVRFYFDSVHLKVIMEALKFAVVLLLVVIAALGSPLSRENPDGEIWTVEKWQGYPLDRGTTIRLADLIKRSKAQQFHGLMGRSPGVSLRLGRKRNNNKGEMFVGLMGRRSLGGDSMEEEWKSDSY